MHANTITAQIVDSAMRVHSALGPGLLESAYQVCLAHDLTERGLMVRREVHLPVVYKGVRVELAYRIDLLVEDTVVVEIKAKAKLLPVHEAQLLSLLRLSNHRVGLLINFHVPHLKDGIIRRVNAL
jgi:GxxExxY protein